MKKTIALLICLALLFTLPGCGATPTEETPDDATIEENTEETEEQGIEQEDAVEEVEEPEEVGSQYTFQTKVTSSFIEDMYGQSYIDTWYNLVDAVMAGETTFSCPDSKTFDWVLGQFPSMCFPVLEGMIYNDGDPDDPVVDGKGKIAYAIPYDELKKKIDDFSKLIEDILNEALKDDYSDFEKALALYEYVCTHYQYDFESEAQMADIYVDWLSCYRLFTEGIGVCGDIATAYNYLLMQAGVDAAGIGGNTIDDGVGHQWSYINLNGHYYHIDPTFGLGDIVTLNYFLMTDEHREESGFKAEDSQIVSQYEYHPPHKDYKADDETFKELWDGNIIKMDHSTHTLHYWKYDENGQEVECTFDYSGW